MQVVFLEAATGDLQAATHFYNQAAEGLGADFLQDVERTLARVAAAPEMGVQTPRGARRLLLARFPYALIYRLEASQVLILAVGHQRRHPDFWLRGERGPRSG